MAKVDTPATVVRKLSDDLCASATFDVAEKALKAKIKGSPVLTEYACGALAHTEVRMSMAVRRQWIVGTEDTVADRKPGVARTYSVETCKKIAAWGGKYMSWPLSSRKVLAVVTMTEVKAEAEMYEAQAHGNAVNGRFFRSIERRMVALKASPMDKVSAVLDERYLEALMAKAKAK